MINYDEMFKFVGEELKDVVPKRNSGKFRIKYNRYEHIIRVYHWMERIISDLSLNIWFREEELRVATIFHDVGHGIQEDRSLHAGISADICRKYLENKEFDSEFINVVEFLVANHSRKELLKNPDTPIELIILMEADLLDDTAALGIVMDTMIEAKEEDVTYQKVYEHILRYTMKDMEKDPMVTEPGRRFWKEKQELTKEFVRQFKQDIDL